MNISKNKLTLNSNIKRNLYIQIPHFLKNPQNPYKCGSICSILGFQN